MKKLLGLISLLFITTLSFGQLVINQSIVESSPWYVGDTVTVKYNVTTNNETPRYLWVRYQYNNKALQLVDNSTTFTQGSSVQTYFTYWNNYIFTPSSNAGTKDLYGQYQQSPWNYVTNTDWNVGQLTVQRTDAKIDGDFATQKFIIKDKGDYGDVHSLDLAYSYDANSAIISSVTTTASPLVIDNSNVIGNTSQFKVRVLFPSNYPDMTAHSVQLMNLDANGNVDWNQSPIAVKPLDSSGEALFTTEVKVGDSLGVFVAPAYQKQFMDNIITVTDAYRAFLAISNVGLDGTSTIFTHPTFEKRVGSITTGDGTFDESDSYYLFAHIMGIDVSQNATIPSSTAQSIRWSSALLNDGWLSGNWSYKVNITSSTQATDVVYFWGGDLDYSHTPSPSDVTNALNNLANSSTNSSMVTNAYNKSIVYQKKAIENANLSVSSKLEGGKVVLTTNLTKEDLAGLQVVMKYDNEKLKLDNVIFDAGNTVTNFSTNKDGRLTFGSIDQMGDARIKVGTPYKLIFTPKTTITSTTGLFYFELSDAVNGKGDKINLVIN